MFKKGHKINVGRKCSEETKKKISLAGKGRPSAKKGVQLSEETKKRMSLSKMGEKNHWFGKRSTPENPIGRNNSNLGKHFSKDWRKKMSLAKIGKKMPQISREKNHNWKGGVTPKNKKIRASIEYKLWREAVFARDNWTCQKSKDKSCKGKKVYLHPHHIKNFAQFPELRFAIDNGITFSKKEHNKFHKKYGYKNNNEEQVKEFINN